MSAFGFLLAVLAGMFGMEEYKTVSDVAKKMRVAASCTTWQVSWTKGAFTPSPVSRHSSLVKYREPIVIKCVHESQVYCRDASLITSRGQ